MSSSSIKRRSARVALLLCLASLLLLPHTRTPAETADGDSTAQTTNLHQWGAVTLFHGLPSDRVRAIAQDADGAMWFGTDAGLARYDGRRTQTVAEAGLEARRVLALRFDTSGALWIGTDAGAVVRLAGGEFRRITETEGKTVTAIATDTDDGAAAARGRVVLATNAGVIFDCRMQGDNTLAVRAIEDRLLLGVGADNRLPLELTSVRVAGERVLVGTRGRGLLAVENDAVREVLSRPRAFFVEAIERDPRGDGSGSGGGFWFGAQTTSGDSGLFEVLNNLQRPSKVVGGATGTVTALRFDERGDLLVGTDGEGVFRYRGRQRLERFTFEGTAGGLRSDRIYSIFIDREGVAWFGTDRGVCRYDPHGLRNESLAGEAQSNFVRVLFQTREGRLVAGTNRGLFVRDAAALSSDDATTSTWRAVEGMSERTVYAVAEDRDAQLLVGTSSGLYVGLERRRREATPARATEKRADETKGKETRNKEINGKETGNRETNAESDDKQPTTNEPSVAGSVRAIASFRKATFIATYGRGLERLERAPDGRLRATLIWPHDNISDPQLREVVSLHADERDGRLWIGTASAGVFFFDGKEVKTEPALTPLDQHAVRDISGSSDAALWFATGRGLYIFRAGTLLDVAPNVDARSVVHIDTTPQQHSSQTSTLKAWCATAGGGLLKVSLDSVFGAMIARLDAEQGLPSQNVFAVLPLKDTPNDGQTQAASGATVLLIGTSRGVSRYEPGLAPPALRPTRITGARAHQPEELRDGLRLEYPQNSLVLDVAATSSRTFPEQFQYAFLLYDDAGAIIKRRFAHESQLQIEDLRPGNYRVEARAYNADLVASMPLAFNLHVARAPFPWTTAALSILLALALVALVWGSVQNARLSRAGAAIMDANRQLAAARLQLANETEAERRRIARDLHDQTLADLRRLLLLTDELQAANNNGAGTSNANSNGEHETIDPSVLRHEIESISNEIRRICEDLSPSVLENVGFAAALEWALTERVAHLPAECRFSYEFSCDDEIEERLRFSPGVEMQIYRIVQEAVSNICRHATATHVRLGVDVTGEGDFVLILEDNGRGFDPSNKHARLGRGLANIRARASIIDAEVKWHKRPQEQGGGIVFTLRKPDAADTASIPSANALLETASH
ncbi:MAG TPA: two-component regulator propeller domain-containing protein [Pyrinomonadaceae bacterium]